MRDDDGASDDEADVEDVEELGAGGAELLAPDDVIRDAVVAAEHHRGGETRDLLGLRVQGAVLVGLRVEVEETIDPEMLRLEDLLVHLLPVLAKLAGSTHRAVL